MPDAANDKLVQQFHTKVLPLAVKAQAESIATVALLKAAIADLVKATSAKNRDLIELHQKGVRAEAGKAGKVVAAIDTALDAMRKFSDQPGFESQMKTLDTYTAQLGAARKDIEATLGLVTKAQAGAEAALKALGKAGTAIEVEWAQLQGRAKEARKTAEARADSVNDTLARAGEAARKGDAKQLELHRNSFGGLMGLMEGMTLGLLKDQIKRFDAGLRARSPSADFLGQYKGEKPKVDADLAVAEAAVASARASRKVLDNLKVKEIDVRKVAEAIGVAVVDAAKLVPYLGAGDSALLKALENLVKARKLDNTPKSMFASLKKIKVI